MSKALKNAQLIDITRLHSKTKVLRQLFRWNMHFNLVWCNSGSYTGKRTKWSHKSSRTKWNPSISIRKKTLEVLKTFEKKFLWCWKRKCFSFWAKWQVWWSFCFILWKCRVQLLRKGAWVIEECYNLCWKIENSTSFSLAFTLFVFLKRNFTLKYVSTLTISEWCCVWKTEQEIDTAQCK